jgi:hypothetical protein
MLGTGCKYIQHKKIDKHRKNCINYLGRLNYESIPKQILLYKPEGLGKDGMGM